MKQKATRTHKGQVNHESKYTRSAERKLAAECKVIIRLFTLQRLGQEACGLPDILKATPRRVGYTTLYGNGNGKVYGHANAMQGAVCISIGGNEFVLRTMNALSITAAAFTYILHKYNMCIYNILCSHMYNTVCYTILYIYI